MLPKFQRCREKNLFFSRQGANSTSKWVFEHYIPLCILCEVSEGLTTCMFSASLGWCAIHDGQPAQPCPGSVGGATGADSGAGGLWQDTAGAAAGLADWEAGCSSHHQSAAGRPDRQQGECWQLEHKERERNKGLWEWEICVYTVHMEKNATLQSEWPPVSPPPPPPPPPGGLGSLMHHPLSWISGLSFDSSFSSPVSFFCLVLLLFLSCHLSAHGPRKFSKHFSLRVSFFCMVFCWAARRWYLVPYGTGIYHYAFICKNNKKLLFLFILKINQSGISKLDGMVDDTNMS